MTIKKYGQRYFAVYDDDGELVCVTVYKKGAREVVRRLAALIPSPTGPSSPAIDETERGRSSRSCAQRQCMESLRQRFRAVM